MSVPTSQPLYTPRATQLPFHCPCSFPFGSPLCSNPDPKPQKLIPSIYYRGLSTYQYSSPRFLISLWYRVPQTNLNMILVIVQAPTLGPYMTLHDPLVSSDFLKGVAVRFGFEKGTYMLSSDGASFDLSATVVSVLLSPLWSLDPKPDTYMCKYLYIYIFIYIEPPIELSEFRP